MLKRKFAVRDSSSKYFNYLSFISILIIINVIVLQIWGCGELVLRRTAKLQATMTVKDRSSSYLIAAPHGEWDLDTDSVVDSFCSSVSWDCVVAKGYRKDEHPINVNRPTEGIKLKEEEESHTDRAKKIYNQYIDRIEAIKAKTLKLYVEIHSNVRSKNKKRIEVATNGIEESDAEKIKSTLIGTLKSVGLSKYSLKMEDIDDIYYHATSNKKNGAMKKYQPTLHFEFHSSMLENSKSKVAQFLIKGLPAITKYFP